MKRLTTFRKMLPFFKENLPIFTGKFYIFHRKTHNFSIKPKNQSIDKKISIPEKSINTSPITKVVSKYFSVSRQLFQHKVLWQHSDKPSSVINSKKLLHQPQDILICFVQFSSLTWPFSRCGDKILKSSFSHTATSLWTHNFRFLETFCGLLTCKNANSSIISFIFNTVTNKQNTR